jgi:acetoin utilization protein AcuB
MMIRDCMTTSVETVRPDDDVATVRERLRRRHVRQLPVVAAGRLIGMVTDRDVRGASDPTASVDTIMTPAPATTTPSTPIEIAAAELRRRKIGALPVIEDETLVGIVSESDLLGALVELCTRLEPTAVLELECPADASAPTRARQLLERHGGSVAWLTAARTHGGRERLGVRVRMPPGQVPEQLLEEAGFTVVSCILSPTSHTPRA